MITPEQCIKTFGAPSKEKEGKYMTIWQVPFDILMAFAHVKFSANNTIGFPKKIYCNTRLVAPLESALRNLMQFGRRGELVTWDGCFIVRPMRGGSSYSIHSWGLAIDLNAATNQLGKTPTLSPGFVKCFTDAGFDWGGVWQRKDGMHFQLSKI